VNRARPGQTPTSLLTTDITRDTPNDSQVRFVAEQSSNPSAARSQRLPGETNPSQTHVSNAPLSVGLTNPILDENSTKSSRSQSQSPSRSPIRENTASQEPKSIRNEHSNDTRCDKSILYLNSLIACN
jgi:hypothetical protein